MCKPSLAGERKTAWLDLPQEPSSSRILPDILARMHKKTAAAGKAAAETSS